MTDSALAETLDAAGIRAGELCASELCASELCASELCAGEPGVLAPPATLTPSKVSRFVTCPLSFRFAYVERLPEHASIHQVRGTLVHRALQLLYGEGSAPTRTPERAAATLEVAWSELSGSGELTELALDEQGEAALLGEGHALLRRYFELEDPRLVHPIGIELDLRSRLGELELHGIIDRLDRLGSGDFVVVDYKTGRAPSVDHSSARLGPLHFYAFLCEQVLGRRPREVRLVYLRDQVVITQSPTDQSMRGLRQRVLAVWEAISRACRTGDFRPNPSRLCTYCSFQDRCPAFQAGHPVQETPALHPVHEAEVDAGVPLLPTSVPVGAR